ncbi:MAG: alanine racemase [Pseudomonadota bacterium]
MSTGKLTIDLSAIASNWRALDRHTACETAAVVKADAYGLGLSQVAPALAAAGARQFFVAVADEGVALRHLLGPGPRISVFSGHMIGDTDKIQQATLTPMLNSIDQMLRHVERLPGHPFGIQLDSGMNRLGMEPSEWAALRDIATAQQPTLIMSHLACADTPDHPMNSTQLFDFNEMTQGIDTERSLSATGGVFLGSDFHFDMTRPGIGLYGGLPYVDAAPVVQLDLPVIQIREIQAGESVGYGNTYIAQEARRVATVSGGYADGLIRAMGSTATMTHEDKKFPVIGRVSMDLITVDITEIEATPEHLQILGPHQSIDTAAEFAETIGYEILTSLGARYERSYVG